MPGASFFFGNLPDSRNAGLYGEDRKALEKKILLTDKKRGIYYKYYTGQEWNDAMNYDLCINTSKLTFEQGVEAIKAFIQIKLQ